MRSKFVILLSILCVATSYAEDDRTAHVRQLYESASYAEALEALSRFDIPPDIADEYRASCLVAVGRAPDAELVLEALVTRRPDLSFDGSDRPPKLVALFRSVQKRVVPVALKQRYNTAKAEYEAGRLQTAHTQFRDLLAMLDRVAPVLERETAADLRTLSEGFVRLSMPPAPAAIQSVPVALPAAVPATPVNTVTRRDVFDESDGDVVPPIAINQRMPTWNPPQAFQRDSLRGVLEILVDENGAVVSQVMRRSAHRMFDAMLLDSAREWRYYPAMRDGRPVKYRKTIVVTVNGKK
jgi:hypothetical protein